MSTHRISLDFETRSRADLRKVGAFKYAEDPSTEVLVIALSKDGGPRLTWDIRQPIKGNAAIAMLRQAITEGWEIHAFNSSFEWAILKYVCPRQLDLPVPDINNLRCTAAVCRSAGLPPSLAKAAEFLKLSVQKDKMGSALIQKFSVPQKKDGGRFIEPTDEVEFTAGGERLTAAAAFQRFVDYCVRDVETEMAVAEAMKPFELKGFVLDWFLADARLNDRGVPVDRVALKNAFALYKEHEADLVKTFRELTGFTPKQNAKVKEWLQARGYTGDKLNLETRERCAKDNMTPEAREALGICAELSFAAVKKIPAMLDWVMEDGFIRGSFMWCGAQKTWRWTSKGVQYQNMKKPKKKLRPRIEQLYQDIVSGIDLDFLRIVYEDPYEVIASLSRYFIRFPDRNVFDADFSQVEAKILPFLIECQRILDRFGSGEDLYVTAAKALGITRDMGKTVVLATQFQGGWNAVFTATGKTWARADCEKAVAVVRKDNPEFGKAWKLFQDSFVLAMEKPGEWHQVTPYVAYAYTKKAPFPRMLMRLASGRKIVMPYPERAPITMVKVVTTLMKDNFIPSIEKSKWQQVEGHHDDAAILNRKLSIGDSFFNPNTRIESWFHTWDISYYGHIEGVHYGRVKTYGGSELQTATQATGADLLAHGLIEAERNGFKPFLLVHDQCLTPAEGDPDLFAASLCKVPDWFKGFPLGADTDEVRSYSKT